MLVCSGLFAQSPAEQRVLSFTNVQAPPERQELAVVVGSISRVRVEGIDQSAGTLTVSGTQEQLAAAQWLFGELDQAPGAGSGTVDHPAGADTTDKLLVIFVTPSATPAAMQEIVYAIHVTGDVQPVVPFPPRKAIAMRCTEAEAGLATWLVQKLDVPPGAAQNTQDQHWFGPADTGDHLVRVFYLDGATTPEQLQDVLNRIRSNAGISRAGVATTARAIAVRGTLEQVTAAGKIVEAKELAPVR